MALITSCQALTKSFALRPLFSDISFGVEDGQRIGLIGPNGSGKSTLLKIMAGQIRPDSGNVSSRKNARISYLAQQDKFDHDTVIEVLKGVFIDAQLDPEDHALEISQSMSKLGFTQPEQAVTALSGGWRKRLALAREILKQPDLVLMDEPTNHLDLEGVVWLEAMLKSAPFATVIISHDRYFLENTVNRMIELSPAYADGYLSIDGKYSDLLSARENYLNAQSQREHTLQGQVKREIEWLRRGPQARTTKAQYRIKAAGNLIGELAETRARNNVGTTAGIDFAGSGRRTKDLIVGKAIRKEMGGRTLFENLDLTLSPGTRMAVIGPNGRGKTTLLRLLTGELHQDSGTIKRADSLRIVFFDQNRASLDQTQTLQESLCPNGDTVIYRDSPMHITSWAKRFLFRPDQLPQPLSSFSGGEQARVVIARLMLQPADVLILDEPTNDLDIPALEVLEESLSSFPGALVLVTHDRYLMDTLCDQLLWIKGDGTTAFFASLDQWEAAQQEKRAAVPKTSNGRSQATANPSRLSSAERKELKSMEAIIEMAEDELKNLESQLHAPSVSSDAAKLNEVWNAIPSQKEAIATLYARWADLESRQT